jgi:tetratricopeptide (TPR) repeat protein
MRASVLKDPSLLKRAGQFAWLSIDSEKPSNAGFNEKFPMEGVPAFLVIDPNSGKATLLWYGTATASQLNGLMEDGLRAMAGGGGSSADALLARADGADARKDYVKAAALYRQAIEADGSNWPKRARIIESLVTAESFAPNHQAQCVEVALRETPTMARDRSFVNTVGVGLQCAKPGTPERRELQKLAEEAVKIPGVLSDDTSSMYMILADSYRHQKDEAAATRTAEAWVEYLKQQLAKAASPDARMALDLQLTTAARFLNKPAIAIPEVERVERELPKDYNPPRLLANLYNLSGRREDAVRACEHALGLAYGPPKLNMYVTCGGFLEKKGDKTGARKLYQDGIAFGKTLPQKSAKPSMEELEKALAKP